jgi:HPt (histidine-containing phosphotransfer) domain-containing protein
MVTINQINNSYTPAPACKVCNMDYLLNISRGNEKIINSLVSLFFSETQDELLLLDKAICKTEYDTISDIAHKLKSSFLILGIVVLENTFKAMEQLSSTSSTSNIEMLSRRVNLVFNQAKEEMMTK